MAVGGAVDVGTGAGQPAAAQEHMPRLRQRPGFGVIDVVEPRAARDAIRTPIDRFSHARTEISARSPNPGRASFRWWYVSLGNVGAAAEKVLFHLAREVLAGTRIGQVQPVFIDQHRLLLEPCGPGFLADVFPDAFAEFAGIGREVETFGLFAELDALDHACHLDAFGVSLVDFAI